MRGKQRQVAEHLRAERITPADAGKTLQYALQYRAVQDHPRGCGENLFYPSILSLQCRITPADAGKTPAMSNS